MGAFLLTIVAAFILLLLYKILWPIVWNVRLRYLLRAIPYVEPPHWLWGHLPVVTKRDEYAERWTRWISSGQRLMLIRFLHRIVVLVSHPETAAVVLRTAEPKGDYGILRAWLGDGLLISSGQRWARDRRLLTRGFHFDILRGYLPVYKEAVSIMLERWTNTCSTCDGQAVNISRSAKLLTLDVILRCIMSHDSDCQNPNAEGHVVEYAEAVQEISQCIVSRFLRPMERSDFLFPFTANGKKFAELKKTTQKTSQYIIQERRQAIAEEDANEPQLGQKRRKYLDFLDILLTVRDEDGMGLSDEEIQEQVDTFLFEGHDTTASALQWTLYYLARHPEIQERCRQEVKHTLDASGEVCFDQLTELHYMAQCIKESQRLCATVPYLSRTLTQPLTIDGHVIPAGTTIGVPIMAVHRHPDVWDRPAEFDPDRFSLENCAERHPFAYIPFSAGPRNCIGQSLAMDELKTEIAMILLRFRLTVDLDSPEPSISSLLVSRASPDILLYVHEIDSCH